MAGYDNTCSFFDTSLVVNATNGWDVAYIIKYDTINLDLGIRKPWVGSGIETINVYGNTYQLSNLSVESLNIVLGKLSSKLHWELVATINYLDGNAPVKIKFVAKYVSQLSFADDPTQKGLHHLQVVAGSSELDEVIILENDKPGVEADLENELDNQLGNYGPALFSSSLASVLKNDVAESVNVPWLQPTHFAWVITTMPDDEKDGVLVVLSTSRTDVKDLPAQFSNISIPVDTDLNAAVIISPRVLGGEAFSTLLNATLGDSVFGELEASKDDARLYNKYDIDLKFNIDPDTHAAALMTKKGAALNGGVSYPALIEAGNLDFAIEPEGIVLRIKTLVVTFPGGSSMNVSMTSRFSVIAREGSDEIDITLDGDPEITTHFLAASPSIKETLVTLGSMFASMLIGEVIAYFSDKALAFINAGSASRMREYHLDFQAAMAQSDATGKPVAFSIGPGKRMIVTYGEGHLENNTITEQTPELLKSAYQEHLKFNEKLQFDIAEPTPQTRGYFQQLDADVEIVDFNSHNNQQDVTSGFRGINLSNDTSSHNLITDGNSFVAPSGPRNSNVPSGNAGSDMWAFNGANPYTSQPDIIQVSRPFEQRSRHVFKDPARTERLKVTIDRLSAFNTAEYANSRARVDGLEMTILPARPAQRGNQGPEILTYTSNTGKETHYVQHTLNVGSVLRQGLDNVIHVEDQAQGQTAGVSEPGIQGKIYNRGLVDRFCESVVSQIKAANEARVDVKKSELKTDGIISKHLLSENLGADIAKLPAKECAMLYKACARLMNNGYKKGSIDPSGYIDTIRQYNVLTGKPGDEVNGVIPVGGWNTPDRGQDIITPRNLQDAVQHMQQQQEHPGIQLSTSAGGQKKLNIITEASCRSPQFVLRGMLDEIESSMTSTSELRPHGSATSTVALLEGVIRDAKRPVLGMLGGTVVYLIGLIAGYYGGNYIAGLINGDSADERQKDIKDSAGVASAAQKGGTDLLFSQVSFPLLTTFTDADGHIPAGMPIPKTVLQRAGIKGGLVLGVSVVFDLPEIV